MDPGNVVLTPSVWHCAYDPDGLERARISYRPTRKTECFALLSLGVMRKGESPGEHAMRVLQELGWTPPGAEGSEPPMREGEAERAAGSDSTGTISSPPDQLGEREEKRGRSSSAPTEAAPDGAKETPRPAGKSGP